MTWLGFRTRSAERDQQTDLMRMQNVLDVLATQISGIENEGNGLRRRYQSAADDAAFSMEAIENGQASLLPKVDSLTDVMVRYKERIRALDAQAAFLSNLRETVLSFMAESLAPPDRRREPRTR